MPPGDGLRQGGVELDEGLAVVEEDGPADGGREDQVPPGAGAVWVIVSVKVSTRVTPGLGGAARVVNEPKIALVVGGRRRSWRSGSNRIWAPPWLRMAVPEEPKTPDVE